MNCYATNCTKYVNHRGPIYDVLHSVIKKHYTGDRMYCVIWKCAVWWFLDAIWASQLFAHQCRQSLVFTAQPGCRRALAVVQCLSVCPFVTFLYMFYRNDLTYSQTFSPSSRATILVFPFQSVMPVFQQGPVRWSWWDEMRGDLPNWQKSRFSTNVWRCDRWLVDCRVSSTSFDREVSL